jgi:hypothetical protein
MPFASILLCAVTRHEECHHVGIPLEGEFALSAVITSPSGRSGMLNIGVLLQFVFLSPSKALD